MLWTIIAILIVLWLLGVILQFTAGGLLHILIIVAVIVLIVRFIKGK